MVYARLGILFGVVKGVLFSIILFLLGVTFIQQLVVALLSGFIGAIGAVLAAYVAVTESRKTRKHVIDVKRKIGADKRVQDDIDLRADPTNTVTDNRSEHSAGSRYTDADLGTRASPGGDGLSRRTSE